MLTLKLIWTVIVAGLVCLMMLIHATQWQPNLLSSFDDSSEVPPRRPFTQYDPNEKFITFLPHSGLHNQRIALINALVLAKQLNRTLLMPELNIGKANYWRESKQLERQLSHCTRGKKMGSTMATSLSSSDPFSHISCHGYRRYMPSTVSNIFDLSSLPNLGIRVVQRRDMGIDYFAREFGAQPSDLVYIRDQSRLSYRIYDSRSNNMEMKNFEQRIDIDDLAARPERIMVFGSLFSSFRLALEKPAWVWLWDYLFSEVGFHHPNVLQQALDIIGRLGGPGQFVSLHLRQGDGVFRAVVEQTIQDVRATLAEQLATSFAPVVVDHVPSPSDDTSSSDLEDAPVDPWQHYRSPDLDFAFTDEDMMPDTTTRLNECLRIQSRQSLHPRLRLIYMATDAPDPRRTLHHLYTEFPCLFSLADFPDIISSTLTATALSPFTEDQQPSRLGPLLFPLIDAEIASHGSRFIGTRKSTFSKYILYRNKRLHSYYDTTTSSTPTHAL
ncbi:hypothetical protein BC940DRAFT_293325 [Gongronella butleri]|nr:hypothetical protein BC940DRAFT_293325 [Gongronella butleri]